MDLDLAQVRAFAAVAEYRHFGRAAAQLSLTQQALSKRILRLEQLLGEKLIDRLASGVELTSAGQRFLPHAAKLLAVSDAAIGEVRLASRPVRIDVWGQVHPPLARLGQLLASSPELAVEVSTRRSLPLAIGALLRGELDVAVGRVRDLEAPWPAELSHYLIDLSPAYAYVSTRSPLAVSGPLRTANLAGARLWAPAAGTSPEIRGWWRRFAEHLGLEMDTSGSNLGLTQAIADLTADAARVAIMGWTGGLGPTSDGIVARPLAEPVLRYPWSVVWRREGQHHAAARLVRRLIELSTAGNWTLFDQNADWLPEPDLADLIPRARREVGRNGARR